MMPFQPLMITAIVSLLIFGSSSHAQSHTPTAQEYNDIAKKEFEAGHYKIALDNYTKAFALESSPANALRMFVASTYVDDLSAASKQLETWFVKKHDDAQKLGDKDDSWALVDTVALSLRSAASRQEAAIRSMRGQLDEQQKKIAELQAELEGQRKLVHTIKLGYDEELLKLQRDFQLKFEAIQTMDRLHPSGTSHENGDAPPRH